MYSKGMKGRYGVAHVDVLHEVLRLALSRLPHMTHTTDWHHTKVCGHLGTISFASPEYETSEAGTEVGDGSHGTIRITVVRTGGGHGTVGVTYQLIHESTDEADVTATAHYTGR